MNTDVPATPGADATERLARNARVVRGLPDGPMPDPSLIAAVCRDAAGGRAAAARIDLGFDPVTASTIAPTATGPVVVAGLATPWLLERVLGACGVCADGYRPRIVVIEPDAARCRTAFACVEVPASSVVTCFSGADAFERFAADLEARYDEVLPRAAVGLPVDEGLLGRARESLKRSWAAQAGELERMTRAVATMRVGRDLAWWSDRFASAGEHGDPLRVMVVSSRFSTFVRHAATRMARAIEAAGQRAEILIEPEDSVRFSAVAGVRRHLSFDPDLVVSINWPRPVLASSWPPGVPSVCWIQDAMPQLFDRAVGEALGPLDFIAGQVHGSLARDFGYPVTNRLFAPVPGCAESFAPVEGGTDDRFSCDIAYISHQSEAASVFIERSVDASAAAPGTARLLRELGPRVVDAVSADRLDVTPDLWTLMSETVSELMGRLPDRGALDRLYLHFVLPLGERAFRHASLRWARRVSDRNGWSFRVFGNGWDRHPEFAEVARPGVEYGEDLRHAYASAGCHLHASLQTNAHQRVFECALAGGVMLRRAPSADRSVFQAEAAKLVDRATGGVGLPDGGAVLYASGASDGVAERILACEPDASESGDHRDGGRIRVPSSYAFLRPLWVPDHPLDLYPDWSFSTALGTQFWTASDLEACVERVVHDASWRARVTEDQRARTLSHNSYGAFWGRLRRFVGDRLAAQHGEDRGGDPVRLRGSLDRNLSALGEIAPGVESEIRERLHRGVVRLNGATTSPGVLESVRESLRTEEVIAIHGLGDGEILKLLLDRPEHLNGRRTAVHAVEPDLDRLAGALAIIDVSGFDGPLRGGDIEWYIGPDWENRVAERLNDRPMLPLPRRVVRPDPSVKLSESVWQRVGARFETEQRSLEAAVTEWAAARDRQESFECIRDSGTRPARVLVLTSRFTSVLRHSAASVADAFSRVGWQVATLCEERDHERITLRSALRLVERFRPDVVFAIDHHRSSFPGLPESVPFVCWIQDDLDALTSESAAAGLGDADFAIGAWMHRYIQEWGYPSEACVGMPRLTDARLPDRVSGADEGVDLCYVSGYSEEPHAVRQALLGERGDDSRVGVIDRVSERLIELYDGGGFVTFPREIAAMLREAHEAMGFGADADPSWVSSASEVLQHRLNNTLYRQQGLRWAAKVADEEGLALGVYGPGWERHPEFRRFAKGPVSYGDRLAELTATVPITLRLEPYPPTSHQRLLDALASGGFVLSRSYGAWHEAEHAFVEFYLEHLAGRAANLAECERLLDGSAFGAFRLLAERAREALDLADLDAVMACYRYRFEHGLLADYQDSPLPPRYFETVFSDAPTMRGLIARAIADPEGRRSLRDEQGSFVRSHYGYDRRLADAMREIGSRLLHLLSRTGTRGEAA